MDRWFLNWHNLRSSRLVLSRIENTLPAVGCDIRKSSIYLSHLISSAFNLGGDVPAKFPDKLFSPCVTNSARAEGSSIADERGEY